MAFDDFDISIQCDEYVPEDYQSPEPSQRVYASLGNAPASVRGFHAMPMRLPTVEHGIVPATLWDDAERWEKAYHEMDTDRAYARREELAAEQERDQS